jgi:hypothetical protein
MIKNTYPFEYHIFDKTDTHENNDDDGENNNSEIKNLLYEKSIKNQIDASTSLDLKSENKQQVFSNLNL